QSGIFGSWSFGNWKVLFLGIKQLFELVHELADVAKVPIHRRKPDVGYLVEPPQLVHHHGTNFRRGHLLFGAVLENRFHSVSDTLHRAHADRTLLTRLQKTRHELLPLEALSRAILLADHV